MNLDCTQADGYQLVTCEGELDESTHQPFRDVVHPLFAEKGTRVLVDLSRAKWINSEGIAALVRLVSDANTRGCQVVLANPNAFIAEVFDVTRLHKFFDVAATHEEAEEMLCSADA